MIIFRLKVTFFFEDILCYLYTNRSRIIFRVVLDSKWEVLGIGNEFYLCYYLIWYSVFISFNFIFFICRMEVVVVVFLLFYRYDLRINNILKGVFDFLVEWGIINEEDLEN